MPKTYCTENQFRTASDAAYTMSPEPVGAMYRPFSRNQASGVAPGRSGVK